MLKPTLKSAAFGGVCAAALGMAVAAFPAAAPAQTAPSHSAAVPDFSGAWQRAGPLPSTFLLPEEGLPGPVWDPQDHADGGVLWLGDTSNPILKVHAAQKVEARNQYILAGNEDLPAWSLCWPVGVPNVLNMRERVQFLQKPDKITIVYQRDHNVRRVYLNQAHSENPPLTWYGESVGHYEGDNTLVIDTIALDPRADIDKFGTPHSGKLHVIERYTIAPDRSMITADVSVEDPETFNMGWYARATYRSTPGAVQEVVCAENNKNASTGQDYPIPKAEKADY